MNAIEMPVPLTAGQRVRAWFGLGADTHVGADQIQEMFDGVLAARMTTRIQKHLDGCRDCAGEAARWMPLFARLDRLETFAPREGFADRVMAGVALPERVPLAARAKDRVTAALGGVSATGHVSATALQDLIDDMLPSAALARIETHLDVCHDCRENVAAWRALSDQLVALERLSPSEGFADRVMQGIRVTAPAPAHVRVPLRSRVRHLAHRLVPQTREAWAALSGVAVTPVVITGLVLYAVFSHSTLTLGSLASFAWWQVTDMATIAFAALSATALQSVDSLGVSSLLDTLTSAPLLVAGGVLVYSMVSALALRVLYRNLIAKRPEKGRYAHVSTS